MTVCQDFEPNWILPDRNTILREVPFLQKFRTLMPEICHKHGAHAIGGMTALFPSRSDTGLNERALKSVKEDKKNEANCLMDGAWTGHPDQNEIAGAVSVSRPRELLTGCHFHVIIGIARLAM
jgi:malate synthase